MFFQKFLSWIRPEWYEITEWQLQLRSTTPLNSRLGWCFWTCFDWIQCCQMSLPTSPRISFSLNLLWLCSENRLRSLKITKVNKFIRQWPIKFMKFWSICSLLQFSLHFEIHNGCIQRTQLLSPLNALNRPSGGQFCIFKQVKITKVNKFTRCWPMKLLVF